jgi:hypothetical protein
MINRSFLVKEVEKEMENKMADSKRAKILLCFSFFIFFLFNISANSQVLNDTSFLPLQIGNQWVFSSQPDTLVEAIVDTQRIGENLYFSFDQFRNLSGYLFRMYEDSVFIYADTAEYLWYNFNADSGDSWIVPPLGPPYFGGAFTIQSKTDTIVTAIGTFTDCCKVHHFIGVDAEFVEWFANGIGIVQRDVITIVGSRRWILSERLTTSMSDEPESTNPKTYLLSQNYPNPFNPTTTIKYQIPELSFVTIKVYDVLGNEISTLVNEEKPVGSYEVEFNATALPSGIYFYRLQAGSFVETKKMILLK